MKKYIGYVLLFLCSLSLISCDNEEEVIIPREDVDLVTGSDSLYVAKVENLDDDFIMGMDASSVLSLEASGVKYYDYEGNEADVFKTLAQSGINYIRVRVWNNPFDSNGNGYGGGNCTIDTALEIGKRATKYGMKLLVNFHYSDFWADPAKQMAPKAWKDLEIEDKANRLYEYTLDSLNKLKAAGVDVGMVQLGNETNGKMSGETVWYKIAQLMAQGAKAVREVFPESLVAVHFANPEKVTNYVEYAKNLDYFKVDYDVFASSYYPYWHGTLDNLAKVLNDITEKYGKKTMVMETSYAYTSLDADFSANTISDGGAITKDYPFTIQGQANSVRNIIDTVANKLSNGIGVCYWEGTWITVGTNSWEENSMKWEQFGSGWASSYAVEYDPKDAGAYYGGCAVDNQALFDSEGKPLESLKVFNLVKNGNVVDIKPDAIADTNLICDLNGTITLPDTVDAVMSDNSKKTLPVEWKYYQVTDENYNTTKYDSLDFNAFKTGGVKKYDIVGVAGGMEAHCYLSMVEYNYLANYSFEEDSPNTKIPTGWTVIEKGHANELYVEEKSTNAITGNKTFHYWGESNNSIEFNLEQKVENLNTGTYKFSISKMGGDSGNYECYAYVILNGQIIAKQNLEINGWNKWNTATIENIQYTENDELIVGIYVKCQGANGGAWGNIEDALLNFQTE